MSHLYRREFLRSAAAITSAAGSLLAGIDANGAASPGGFGGTLCLFSKHLPWMNWAQLAETVKRLGFAGVDLTVRPGGHVLPERAETDLERAVAAIRERGVEVPMITTGLLKADDPAARPILSAAGRLGIKYAKPGYYRYAFADVRRELEAAGRQFAGLVEMAQRYGVEIGYHNHASYIGAAVWDMARVIDGLDPKWAGYYFDVRHAVVEGGAAGWKIAFNLVAPRLKMIAVKDFYWAKTARGWVQRDCPLGEGMVDWAGYFKLLRESGFRGPVSLHIEYEIAGATASEREAKTIEAIVRDLEFLKGQLRAAYAG